MRHSSSLKLGSSHLSITIQATSAILRRLATYEMAMLCGQRLIRLCVDSTRNLQRLRAIYGANQRMGRYAIKKYRGNGNELTGLGLAITIGVDERILTAFLEKSRDVSQSGHNM